MLLGLDVMFHLYRMVKEGFEGAWVVSRVDEKEREYAPYSDHARGYFEWAEDEHFGYVGSYAVDWWMAPMFMVILQHRETPTFFCVYYVRQQPVTSHSLDLVTVFSDALFLTTGSNGDGQLLPRRRTAYMQTFSYAQPADLWARHIQAERYLVDAGGVQMYSLDRTFEQVFADALQDQMRYVFSLRFWTARMLWWSLVRRSRWHGRSIEQQHKDGWIQLPNEHKLSSECR